MHKHKSAYNQLRHACSFHTSANERGCKCTCGVELVLQCIPDLVTGLPDFQLMHRLYISLVPAVSRQCLLCPAWQHLNIFTPSLKLSMQPGKQQIALQNFLPLVWKSHSLTTSLKLGMTEQDISGPWMQLEIISPDCSNACRGACLIRFHAKGMGRILACRLSSTRHLWWQKLYDSSRQVRNSSANFEAPGLPARDASRAILNGEIIPKWWYADKRLTPDLHNTTLASCIDVTAVRWLPIQSNWTCWFKLHRLSPNFKQ